MNQLTNQVKQNLEYYTLWTDVKVHEINDYHIVNYNNNSNSANNSSCENSTSPNNPAHTQPPESNIEILCGYPPRKLSSVDEDHLQEWVIPILVSLQESLSVKQINHWFSQIALLTGKRPKRVTVGLVNDDSTVVYYFIHDGIVTPVQN